MPKLKNIFSREGDTVKGIMTLKAMIIPVKMPMGILDKLIMRSSADVIFEIFFQVAPMVVISL